MVFKRIYDEDLSQASYFIGCQEQQTALVVDPRRDVQVYLDEAEESGMRIVAVTETHIHADYLSGALELAQATGAGLYLSGEGGEDWQYRFAHEGLEDGSEITLGKVRVRALHTPGHTPEHLSFLITDGATTDQPGFLLSGDFVFVGDLGRPDLLDESGGGKDSREPMARAMFKSLQETFLNLPDYVQVRPGHGAGSACGKALGAVPSSTVGYERLFAWWGRYLENDDEAGFAAALLDGQPDAPFYFSRMKRQNRQGPAILGERGAIEHLGPRALEEALAGGAVFIDTRPRSVYERGTVPGALHLPAGKTFSTWAAWIIDPEADERPLILLADDQETAQELRDKLARVGIDRVAAYASSLEGLALEPRQQTPLEDFDAKDAFVLDVRTRGEYEDGHLPGATRIHAGRLLHELDDLPRDRPIVVHCQAGNRSAVASSVLRAAGFDNVYDLSGGYSAWAEREKNKLPGV